MGKQRKRTDSHALLNQGQENEMDLFGFRTQNCRSIFCTVGYVFSLGFLLLLFYWKPEWDVWAHCTLCSLKDADVILLRTTDAFKQYSKKRVFWVALSPIHKAFAGKDDAPIIADQSCLENRVIMKPELKVRCLEVQKIRYVWDESEKQFQKIGVLEDTFSCSDIHSKFGSGFTSKEQMIRKQICGPNTIEVDITPIWKLLFKEVLNPFYWFQAASISLWVAYEYYEYSLAIMIITIISIIVTVYDLRQQSINLHDLVEAHNNTLVTVWQKDGGCKEIESRHLVPGDVFILPGKKLYLPCDAILLNGSCIVDEGMLTGESLPVTKVPLPNIDNSVPWRIQSEEDYKKHVLFCGTELIQIKASSLGPAKAAVLQTGFNTAKGDLVRSILYSKPVDAKLYRDAVRFLLCLLVVSFLGMIYSVTVHTHHGVSAGENVIFALFILTCVVPPSLPAGLAVGIMYAQKRLKRRGIFCISPQRINMCGWLNLVCFDKTGTLTEDGLDLWGVIPSGGQSFQKVHLFRSDYALPWGPLLGALASCHSLLFLDGKLQGDPLDLKMFEGTRWIIDHSASEKDEDGFSSAVIIKPGPGATQVPVEGVAILHQFPFSSSLQRMSVITRVLGAEGFLAFMKGAPEMVVRFCRQETVPFDFSSKLELYTMQGFRVIGMAYKPLPAKPNFSVDSFTREEVESELEFLGLLVMENKVKAATKPALQELNTAQIRTVMITGDNLQTALTVARHSGMVSERSKAILVEANGPEGSTPASMTLQTREDEKSNGHITKDILISVEGQDPPKYTEKEFHFAMSGKSYQVIVQHFYSLLPKLLLNGVVFARMSPRQKTSLIEEFQKLDYFVGMCGDGANDCGALKMAHAGVSLSEQEASVASPFTSRTPNIQCIPHLIKEGRAALVSSICVFKYIIITCLVAFNCELLLFWQNKFLGNFQYVTQDMGIAFLTYLTITLNQACPELAPYRPLRKLISLPVLVSTVTNFLSSLILLICTFLLVQKQPWYSSTDFYSACIPANQSMAVNMSTNGTVREASDVQSFETTSMWAMTSISYIAVAFVVSKGKPFRKPLYTNYVHSVVMTAQIVVFLFLIFTTNDAIRTTLELVCTPTYWRVSLIIMLLVYFTAIYTVEEYIVDNRRFWKSLQRCFKYESKSKYRIAQRLLAKDPNWPPLNVTRYAEPTTAELESKVGLLAHSV
ncbi:probable cation-transporting ATPase 13A4 isoform X2 [Ambystoma mexicanum]|uniref:probable cation-transporting ATPase 13A4 isoform X2 n=1 Tax=Ambystoma mexicanum TaxID=8296 RepID=UPI0037E8DCF0